MIFYLKKTKKLGEIQARQGFLVAENDKTGHDYDGIPNIENAIIAISDAGRIKIMEIYNEMKYRFQKSYPLLKSSPHYVYTIMENIVYYTPLSEALSVFMSGYKGFNEHFNGLLEEKRSLIQETFGFKTNGGEVDIQYDNSWMKNKDELYTKEEIAKMDSNTTRVVATNIQELIVNSIFDCWRAHT